MSHSPLLLNETLCVVVTDLLHRNYQGSNYIAFSLWSLESSGSKVAGLELSVNGTILSGYGDIPMVPMSSWHKRAGAY